MDSKLWFYSTGLRLRNEARALSVMHKGLGKVQRLSAMSGNPCRTPKPSAIHTVPKTSSMILSDVVSSL